jgi:hypothetical protein
MAAIKYTNQPFKTYQKDVVGQTLEVKAESEINAQSYQLGIRNYKNYYEIPTDKDKVYLNFTAKKTMLYDSMLDKIGSRDFEFFVDRLPPGPDLFTLPNGSIYRCLGQGLKDNRSYTYYVVRDGVGRKIPDYKTLEVMLTEKGISYTSIFAVEEGDCKEIPVGEPLPSRAGEWSADLGDSTGYTTLANLAENIATLDSIVAQLGGSVSTQQDMVQNDLAAQAAQMQAASAQAQSAADAAAANNAAATAATVSAQADADAALAAAVSAQLALQNATNN